MPHCMSRVFDRTESPTRRPAPVSAAIALALLVGPAFCHSFAADRVRSTTPVAVISARDVDRLTGATEYLLTAAGATSRADQLRGALTLLNGFNGLAHDRPLGLLACLPVGDDEDRRVQPDFIGFLPVDSMEDLQQSLSVIQRISLTPQDDAGMWELTAGRTTLSIRIEGGYAFVARHADLLADPLPDVAALTSPHAAYDLALSILPGGAPDQLRQRAIAGALRNLQRDAERDRPSDPGERELHSRIVTAAGWLIERSLRDVEHTTVGLRMKPDDQRIEFDVTTGITDDTPLSEAIAQLPAAQSQFRQLPDRDSPLAVSATGTLSGEVHEFMNDAVDRLRRNVERRMEQDGTANGPAAAPIRQMLDALTKTVADGRMDACILFGGEQPGSMLMLAAARLEQADATASALEDFLLLIAETPAVADLELNVVQVDGVNLHRLTLQDLRRQDEWLYGADVGLYLGAGRDSLWLALGGFEREPQIESLLQRPQPDADEGPPTVAELNVRLKPWVTLDGERAGNAPRWLKLAQEAFADGGDWLHVDLTAVGNELRLQGSLEEGYIRFARSLWRARQQRSNSVPAPNLAAPRQPDP